MNKMIDSELSILGILLDTGKGSIGNIINGFYKEGHKDISCFMEGLKIFQNIIGSIENYHYYEKKFTIMMNKIVPIIWQKRYIFTCFTYMNDFMSDLPVDSKIIKYLEEFNEFMANNYDVAEYLLKTITSIPRDIEAQFGKTDLLNEEFLKELSDETIKKDTELILIEELEGVKLYHGTSYDNYLQIKKDGYIKATNYTDASFQNKKVEKFYNIESGYVFLQDSLDQPLCFCFDGYRKNAIPWAYTNEKDYSDSEYKNIGVIFEINPEKYDVYFHVGKNEFMIMGDISIDDVNVFFYDCTLGNISVLDKIKDNKGVE